MWLRPAFVIYWLHLLKGEVMDSMQSLEVTGENVEEAVASGLKQLGVGPGDVLVEVLEESSRGVFGIGAKPARVRLKLLRPPESNTSEQDTPTSILDPDFEDNDDLYAVDSVADGDDDGTIGQAVLVELLEKMSVSATVNVYRSDSNRSGESAPWVLDVEGDNLSALIGRRGETLSSLQYITRLIASRKLERRANIIVDVAGYKDRRSDRLEQLATRMADQAVKQNQTISLEPMPPNERRIVHLTLRSRADVDTKSTGEGASRKVTIIPK